MSQKETRSQKKTRNQKKTRGRAAGCRQWRSPFFAALPVLTFFLAVTGAVATPVPAPETRKSQDNSKSQSQKADPRLLFTDHGIFEGTITRQAGGNAFSTPERRTHPVSLPAGTYRHLPAPTGSFWMSGH